MALSDVTVAIQKNEFFTLLGPSGCGKTTLLRLIAGFDHPTEGVIKLNDLDISHLPPYQRSVNTVFQSYALFPHMTVLENVMYGLTFSGFAKDEARSRLQRLVGGALPDSARARATRVSASA